MFNKERVTLSDLDFSKFFLAVKVENGLKGSKSRDKKTD